MKLIASPTSPYVRKVLIVADLLGLADQIEVIPADRSDPSIGICRENPLGKVPTLLTDDLGAIYDSITIVEYLCSLSPNTLLPTEGHTLWRAKTQHSLANGVTEAAFNLVKSKMLPGEERSPTYETRMKNGVEAGIKAFADMLDDLSGDTVVGISVACALGYIDFRTVSPDWRQTYPALATWADDVLQQPAFLSTAPPEGA